MGCLTPTHTNYIRGEPNKPPLNKVMTINTRFVPHSNPQKRLAYLVLTKSYSAGKISKEDYEKALHQLGITNEV